MALRFIDGFDHYSSGAQKWTTSSIVGFASATSRFGVGKYIQTGNNGGVAKGFDSQATWVVGLAFRQTGGSFGGSTLIMLRDSGNIQTALVVTTSAGLQVVRGGGTVLGSSAVGILSLGVWYYVEFKITINNTTGAFDVRLNGVAVPGLSATGQNTRTTTNNSANELVLSGALLDIDDVYLCDSTGSAPNNDFLGDVRVDTIFPTADGSTTDFTPSTGTDNYAMVDDAAPDSDSTYVSSDTLNAIDLYTFADLQSLTGTVYGIQTVLFARKDDAGVRSVAPAIKTGATTAVGADFVLSASYSYNLQLFETNPANGSAAWTISDVNNSEFGFKLTA